MKQILFILLLSVGALTTFAQTSAELSKQEQYNQEVRSKMLRKLKDSIHDPVFNRKLSHIVCEQNPNQKYVTIDKFSIKDISKSDNVMTIKARTKLGEKIAGVKTAEIVMSFDNGISSSPTINDLFSDLGRYIKE